MTHNVAIIESEKRMGQRVESIRTFNDLKSANKYILEFNSKNTKATTPDWYMYARLVDQ